MSLLRDMRALAAELDDLIDQTCRDLYEVSNVSDAPTYDEIVDALSGRWLHDTRAQLTTGDARYLASVITTIPSAERLRAVGTDKADT